MSDPGFATQDPIKETDMPIVIRSLSGLAVVAVGLIAAAGAYTESHRVADQS